MQCARHPAVETGLACGRCGTPICPRCAVMTDVGARCPACAPARKLPQFEVGPSILLRAAAAALASGAGLGLLWGALFPGGFGFFGVFLGIGLGYGVAEPVSIAANRKSGTALQIVAAAGVVLAYIVRNLTAAGNLVITNDLGGAIIVIVAAIVAANRLRF